jgi:hypothetical protein
LKRLQQSNSPSRASTGHDTAAAHIDVHIWFDHWFVSLLVMVFKVSTVAILSILVITSKSNCGILL